MVMLRFTKLIDQVLNHTKKQTIRLRSEHRQKHPLAEGQTLQVYLLFKLGDAKITKLQTKTFIQMDSEDAQQDGFEDFLELSTALVDMHGLDLMDPDLATIEWDIITFEPEWDPQQLCKLKDLESLGERLFAFERFKKEAKSLFESYRHQGQIKHHIPHLVNLVIDVIKKDDEVLEK